MNILCIGDVCGSIGCAFLRKQLPQLKRDRKIDMIIVNGENSADGNGILPTSAKHIYDSGAHVITGGNHSFRRREVYTLLDDDPDLLRPANYPPGAPGHGMTLVDFGYTTVAVINLLGTVYLDAVDCPFRTAERLVDEAKAQGAGVILIDFHAEATAEKRALACALDGRISALFGTHTHVQTADATVLPGGTGFITDLGMTGPIDSVLGVKAELAIAKMKSKLPVRFELAGGDCMLNGCVFEIDHKSGKCLSATPINLR